MRVFLRKYLRCDIKDKLSDKQIADVVELVCLDPIEEVQIADTYPPYIKNLKGRNPNKVYRVRLKGLEYPAYRYQDSVVINRTHYFYEGVKYVSLWEIYLRHYSIMNVKSYNNFIKK